LKRKREDKACTTSKYLRRGEADQKRYDAYLQDQGEKNRKQREKEEIRVKEIVEKYKAPVVVEEKTEEVVIPGDEVIRRLKARNLPITLFGEDDIMRAERLRQLELKEPMEYIGAGEFEGSDFLKAMDNAEVNIEEDIEVQKKKKQKKTILISKLNLFRPRALKKRFCSILEKSFVVWLNSWTPGPLPKKTRHVVEKIRHNISKQKLLFVLFSECAKKRQSQKIF